MNDFARVRFQVTLAAALTDTAEPRNTSPYVVIPAGTPWVKNVSESEMPETLSPSRSLFCALPDWLSQSIRRTPDRTRRQDRRDPLKCQLKPRPPRAILRIRKNEPRHRICRWVSNLIATD